MTRPTYETQSDRNNERRLAAKIEKHYGCVLQKMPMKLSLDFMAIRDGKAVAFIEARQRKIAMNTYPTYMLSLYKAMQARSLTMTTGLPCFLAVQWTDKAGIAKLPPSARGYARRNGRHNATRRSTRHRAYGTL
jgi:hypothetical protein